MLWKIAIHGGHIHPDFIRDKLTDRQLHEIAWYFEMHPFGHDVDHYMLAKIVCSMTGGSPSEHVPKIQREKDASEIAASMPGMSQFMSENDIYVEEEE